MKRILVTASGGAPALGFVRSLRDAPEPMYMIGCDCNEYNLLRSETDEKILIPKATDPSYIPFLKKTLKEKNVDFIHCQPDIEVGIVSKHRDELGVRTFLPNQKTIDVLRNKAESYRYWEKAGLKVPKTILVNTVEDLKMAFEQFGLKIWLREIEGAAGKGSLASPTFDLAREWITLRQGWGRYTAAEKLSRETVTWMSLYKNGELIVAQGRKRLYWEFADRTQSGVTGITGTGMTVSDPRLDETAQRAVFAIDGKPNGIFSVDLTYDADGIPNPTEINIGKFFTTHYFFTKAGLNMPYIYLKLAFGEPLPEIPRILNPLPEGLLWIRGMDKEPLLTTIDEIENAKRAFKETLGSLKNDG
ncbi:MAG TPA: carboxylate--amine ligase [Nitrospiria bacterium]|nr:carboxylate--amine ligase [Nitrospiria bacterium]